MQILGKWVEMPMIVAGVIDYFPTLYLEDGPFFIANLDYLFSQAGGLYHYDIWVKAKSDLTARKLSDGMWDLKLPASIQGDAGAEIRAEQARPERQGFYGILSVGFIAAALVTALGFLIYSLVSFQRRAIELGTLRAIGLSTAQMIAYVAGEQLALVAMGTMTGALLGIATGALFVPFLQVGSAKYTQTPPFIVRAPVGDVALILAGFAAVLVTVVAITLWLLRRMRIFEAVKMEDVG